MAKITPFKRVTSPHPPDDPGRGAVAQVLVQTPVDLIATHVLCGGRREDGQPSLRLAWRIEPAA